MEDNNNNNNKKYIIPIIIGLVSLNIFCWYVDHKYFKKVKLFNKLDHYKLKSCR